MNSGVRIGIDGRALSGNRTGIGRYVYHLCRELDKVLPDAQFIVYSQGPLEMPIASERWMLKVDESPLARRMKPVLWLKAGCGRLCKHDGLDIFWGSGTFLPALSSKVRSISTVYDLNWLVAPETMSLAHLWSHKLFFKRDLNHAGVIAAISEGTAGRLHKLIGRQADLVVRPAVDEHFKPHPGESIRDCLSKYKIMAPYLLAVGTWEPRKNLALLVDTYLAMKSDGLLSEHQLVLVGGRGWKDERLASIVAASPDRGILPLGYVPDADLPPLYAGADVFVFPSIYEGFGLPVLEARACGARVVTTDLPELREAGGSDAVYVQPNRDELRKGIMHALMQPQPGATTDLPSWASGAKLMAEAIAGTQAQSSSCRRALRR